MELIGYLRDVFSSDIHSVPINLPTNIPNYLRSGYDICRIIWGNQECLVAAPPEGINLQSMKKHVQQLEKLTGIPTALNLPWLTALQRSNLVQSRIPFVSAGKQVYFPFWGCVFTEKYEKKEEPRITFTPATQAVYLYLIYHSNEQLTLSQIADRLNVSNTTLSRAVRELGDLVSVRKSGHSRVVTLADRIMIRGYERMKSPIEKKVYVRNRPSIHMLGGVKALSHISMIATREQDGAYVISRKDQGMIPSDVISAEEYRDLGGYEIEVWSYAPLACTEHPNLVDELSLLLTLTDDPDERVQMALDGIREKYGLEVDS